MRRSNLLTTTMGLGVLSMLAASCQMSQTNEAASSLDATPAENTVNMDAMLAETVSEARFDWFRYTGRDPVFEGLPAGHAPNPILAGFYPDPSITQAGDAYYLVNSTFTWFPGIPVFRSTDLVTWEQIGNAIDRPSMLDFNDRGLSEGVFAPTIDYHEGVFYIANTCVECGGNFILTATDPEGPWSDPVFIPDVGGIDPSLFFDADGKIYLMNNDEPPGGSTYDGHRAIWIREIDPVTFQPATEPIVIIDGGVRPEENPIWIEGPHIYRIGDWYYFSCAEGGTSLEHSQVILRSKSVLGPYTPYESNPILTQRDLPDDRPNPVTALGHADFVQDADGDWWAVFLGIRPYEVWNHNTGRETFIAPVEWRDGWPVILDEGEILPFSVPVPAGAPMPDTVQPVSGNFSIEYTFDESEVGPEWMTPRIPSDNWHSLVDGALVIEARPVGLGDGGQPSLLARRQQHHNSEAETQLLFRPGSVGEEAGLVAFHDDFNFVAIGIGLDDFGRREVRLTHNENGNKTILARQAIADEENTPIHLKITTDGRDHDFGFSTDRETWTLLADDLDGRALSMERVDGFSFTGVMLGVYAVSTE